MGRHLRERRDMKLSLTRADLLEELHDLINQLRARDVTGGFGLWVGPPFPCRASIVMLATTAYIFTG
jgi:hypothetical protein